MVLSSDELEIVEYLKSCKGKPVGIAEICRCAGGRKKFKENPQWAKGFVVRLVDAELVEVNERGHYRYPLEREETMPKFEAPPPVVQEEPVVVGEDFFPSTVEADPEETNTKWWLSPQIMELFQEAKEEESREQDKGAA